MPPAFATYYSFSFYDLEKRSDDCFHETVQHVKQWLPLIVQLCRVWLFKPSLSNQISALFT